MNINISFCRGCPYLLAIWGWLRGFEGGSRWDLPVYLLACVLFWAPANTCSKDWKHPFGRLEAPYGHSQGESQDVEAAHGRPATPGTLDQPCSFFGGIRKEQGPEQFDVWQKLLHPSTGK